MTSTARYTLPVDPGEATDVLTARLWAAGALGVWERTDDLVAWFADRDVAVPAGGTWADEPARDWQAEWKAGITPVRAGSVVVVPTWLVDDHVADPDELTIVLDPGRAFGSGHHATTTLCLEALQAVVAEGARVLDVGTGTGILAIAAARLGAGRCCGVDIDPDAVEVARANAVANNVDCDLHIGGVEAAGADETFDVVVANLLTHTVVSLADALVARVAPGGVLVASGIGEERAPRVADALTTAGLDAPTMEVRDGWAVLVGRRPGGGTDRRLASTPPPARG